MPKKFSYKQVADAIVDQCNVNLRDVTFMLVDTEYEPIPADRLREIISTDTVNEVKYEAEKFDCDDFALILAGKLARWSAGIIHVKYTGDNGTDSHHALNIAVLDNGRVVFIEPQTDEIFQPNDDYEINFIYM